MQSIYCKPSNTSSGADYAEKMVARGLTNNYDTMQGDECTTLFYPITANRLYANVPIYFDKDKRLINKLLTCMELVDGSTLATYGGVDMPSSFKKAWVVLKDKCDNLLIEFPISKINRVLNGGKNVFFKTMPVDWSKSYIQLTDTSGLGSAGFLFRVWTVNK